MQFSFTALSALLASISYAVASPIDVTADLETRAATQSSFTDADIVNFALVLEHLEAAFYAQGVKNYTSSDFTNAGFVNTSAGLIQRLSYDEDVHVGLLSGALAAAGATPASACNYSFPVTDAAGFLGLSRVLESVGVSAYLGAAQYITSAEYLTVAASILAIEARHQSLVAYFDGVDPLPSPFDTPLGPRFVVTLAGQFITGCPNNASAPPVMGFPALTVTTSSPSAGSNISLTVGGNASTDATHCAFISGLTPLNFTSYSNGSCEVPAGDVGQTYVVLTSSDSSIADDDVVAGPAILVLGQGNANGTIVSSRSGSSGSSSGSGSGSGSNTSSGNGNTGSAAKVQLGLTSLLAIVGLSLLL